MLWLILTVLPSIWTQSSLQLGRTTVLFMMFARPCRRDSENQTQWYVSIVHANGDCAYIHLLPGRVQSFNCTAYNDS